MTHAFFKALLFMVSSVQCMRCRGELDMRKWKFTKETTIHSLDVFVRTLAIVVFSRSHNFSKDEILYYSMQKHLVFWIIGAVLAAVMTSFYMFRSVFHDLLRENPGLNMMWLITCTNLHRCSAVLALLLLQSEALSYTGYRGRSKVREFPRSGFCPGQGHH